MESPRITRETVTAAMVEREIKLITLAVIGLWDSSITYVIPAIGVLNAALTPPDVPTYFVHQKPIKIIEMTSNVKQMFGGANIFCGIIFDGLLLAMQQESHGKKPSKNVCRYCSYC